MTTTSITKPEKLITTLQHTMLKNANHRKLARKFKFEKNWNTMIFMLVFIEHTAWELEWPWNR